MLQLKSADLKALAFPQTKETSSGVSGVGLGARSTGTLVVSTGLGAGLLYIGMKKKGWWHVATFLGATNLVFNGADIIDRVV